VTQDFSGGGVPRGTASTEVRFVLGLAHQCNILRVGPCETSRQPHRRFGAQEGGNFILCAGAFPYYDALISFPEIRYLSVIPIE